MAGAGILWNDVLAAYGAPPVLSHSGPGSSTQVDTLPLSNLLDRRVAKVSRILRTNTTSISSTILTFNLASYFGDKNVTAIMVAGFRYADASNLEMFSSFTFSADFYSAPATIAHSTGNQTINVAVANVPRVWVYLIPASVGAFEKIVLTIKAGSAGATTGYLDIGRVFSSNGIVLANGVDFDWVPSANDSSHTQRSRGQQLYTDNVTRYRTISCNVSNIPEALAIGSAAASTTPTFQLLALQAGSSGEVIVTPRTSDVTQMQRLTVYGRLGKVPAVPHKGSGYYQTSLDVEEGL